MTFDWSAFGERAAHVTLHEVQAEAERKEREQAKAIILSSLMTVTCDHEGKHLNERTWHWVRDLVESL